LPCDASPDRAAVPRRPTETAGPAAESATGKSRMSSSINACCNLVSLEPLPLISRLLRLFYALVSWIRCTVYYPYNPSSLVAHRDLAYRTTPLPSLSRLSSTRPEARKVCLVPGNRSIQPQKMAPNESQDDREK